MRTLILILTHQSERHVVGVLSRLPSRCLDDPTTDVLLIDDASSDRTAIQARDWVAEYGWHNVRVLRNRQAQGHGGNQKVGYQYALRNGYDAVATLPVDGHHSPEAVAALVDALRAHPGVDGVLAVGARRSVGGRALSRVQSRLASARLRGWNAELRAFRTEALARVAFELNTNESHFDTEILLQLLDRGCRIVEVDVPGPSSRPRGLRHARQTLKATLKFRLQRYNLLYDIRFHPELVLGDGAARATVYEEKLGEDTPHAFVLGACDIVSRGARVADLGCATGYVGRALTADRGCEVVGVDVLPPGLVAPSVEYHSLDLEHDHARLNDVLESRPFDIVLMLDVLEHLAQPELTLLNLARRRFAAPPVCLFSTGNVAFIVIRLMLLLGFFNYGKKGILDVTHKRLFSLRTFRNLLEQTGFVVRRRLVFPVPFRALGFPPRLAALLGLLNRWLLRLSPSLFAYQVLFVATPLQRPDAVLEESLALPPHDEAPVESLSLPS